MKLQEELRVDAGPFETHRTICRAVMCAQGSRA
jgi:hypothetical protein